MPLLGHSSPTQIGAEAHHRHSVREDGGFSLPGLFAYFFNSRNGNQWNCLTNDGLGHDKITSRFGKPFSKN